MRIDPRAQACLRERPLADALTAVFGTAALDDLDLISHGEKGYDI